MLSALEWYTEPVAGATGSRGDCWLQVQSHTPIGDSSFQAEYNRAQ